ncbi:MAG: FkbM family methyltransferase [Gammaproteobacteria bacterium]
MLELFVFSGLRSRAVSLLESHPYGYALGVHLVTATDLFLPHDQDYYGFKYLAGTRRTGLFLDLGANRGHSARGFAKLVPGWDVLSVEPNPLHEAQLRKLARKSDRFQYRIAAIDSTSGCERTLYVPFFHRTPLHSAAALTLAEATSGIELSFPRQASKVRYVTIKVLTIAIDDLGIEPHIVKFDVQGAELNALKGATRTLTTLSPDLLVEITFSERTLITHLEPFGYRPYVYKHSRGLFVPYLAAGTTTPRNVFFSKRILTDTRRS